MKKFFMLAIGVVALLVIAACAPQDPPQDVPMPQDAPPADPVQQDPVQDPFEQVTQPELPEIVATVNGEPITAQEVLGFQSQLEMQGMQTEVEEAVSHLVTRKLLIQEAYNRGYQATTSDVEEMLTQQGFPPEEAREQVEMAGLDYEEFLEDQLEEVMLQALMDDKVASVEISSEEALQFYEEQALMMGEERPFEEAESDIRQFLAGQEANQLLSELANDLLAESDVELHY